MITEIETREGKFADLSDEDGTNETSRHDFSESTTTGAEMDTSGQGMVGTIAAIELSAHAATGRSTSLPQVTYSPDDIPGGALPEPFEQHTVSALRWWLLCRGIKVPTSWRKKMVIDR